MMFPGSYAAKIASTLQDEKARRGALRDTTISGLKPETARRRCSGRAG
ncbi:hypothetical protein HNQ96_004557 [Aminobacter lissarensis]|uniref:Uncharacterized protein n=1 Tax=Aminobacter carboxidus TaxID=376165 RepID=A0A8E1WIQ0_9HYPH|nr:hypothetical protein [Aminobacter lissarensis]